MDQVNRIGIVRALLVALVFAGGAVAQNTLLMVRPSGANFDEVRKGMVEALGEGWAVKDLVVTRELAVEGFATEWKASSPKAIVLLDNRAVSLYREARAIVGDSSTPVVALMGVRIDLAVAGLGNAVGINYEIPAVTSMVNLRSVVKAPFRRIGVVHRASWKGFIEQQDAFCRPESLQIVAKPVADDADPASSLRTVLNELVEDEGVEVLWILNDNLFLTPKLIQGTWMPRIRKSKVLSVVGVEALVNPALDFGSFAVLPDHYALGSQAAGLVQEIQDAGWKVEDPRVDQPLSVVKILNAKQVKNRVGVKDEKLGEIDKVLE